MRSSHGLEGPVGLRRELDPDRIAGPDRAALGDDPHHPRLPDQPALGVPVLGLALRLPGCSGTRLLTAARSA